MVDEKTIIMGPTKNRTFLRLRYPVVGGGRCCAFIASLRLGSPGMPLEQESPFIKKENLF
ncbi:MAG: hypothetical protein MZV70_76035 [Desulfobacterales bacterium]|nr:hypothetical protein [Desulfobacterales bacterium]